jgi:exopolysaccharide biosynthesis polyprenyl glycosylphosphotransferase
MARNRLASRVLAPNRTLRHELSGLRSNVMTMQVSSKLKTREADAVKVSRRDVLAAAADPPPASFADALDVVAGDGRASDALIWREALHRRLLALGDMASTTIAVVLVLSVLGKREVAVAAVAGAALLVFLFKAAGLYDRDDLRMVHSTLDEVPVLAQLTGLFALGLAILDSIIFVHPFNASQIAALWIIALCAVLAGRVMARAVAGRTSPVERCLVFGEVGRAEGIREKLAASRARASVIASLAIAGEGGEEIDWVSSPDMLRDIVAEFRIHRIIIAPATTDTRGVVDLIRVAKAVGVRVSVLPRMFEVVGSAVEFDDLDGMMMLGIRRFGLGRSSRALKRMFDIVVASIALLMLTPIISVIAVAIWLESRGPIFFRQVRVGRDGKHFRIFKFRSMVVDADTQKEVLRSLNEAGVGLFKIADDPRMTSVGRFLRHTSLDELPQLLNVLRGKMSLVGPRPLVIDEDAQVLGLDRSRLHLTPGMTGPWQVLGVRVPMQEMVGIDYLYVANWSLWLDCKILIRTARHVLRRGNV